MLRARQRLDVVAVVALDVAVELPVVVDEHDEARDRAGKGAERGTGRRVLEAPGQEELRQEDHRDDAEDLLHDLRDRRRRHALPALQIAARGREERDKEDRRREHDHREVRARIADEVPLDEPVRREVRQDGEEETRDEHEPHRDAEDALRAVDVLERHALRRDDGDGHRHAGLRDRHRKEIDREGHLVEADTFTAEDTRHEDPVEGADDLDDKAGNRQDKRALEEGLSLA